MRESRYWILSLVAAACLVVLLGTHLFLMHLDTLLAYLGMANPDPLDYSAVMARGRSGGWVGAYILLLAFSLYHGLYGLRSVLSEVVSPPGQRMLTWAVIAVGFIAFTWGTYVVIKSSLMGGV
ncbi:hypothetical protein [Thermanaeromonas sp. C210]|uniref:hypothetical protein n=1 Tax=Thermanaeromonas sp. C210 TaxID=2731925 RepID=UPI00155BE561|nr:hypothetical protein [Thermanaeromonas sp. C210]GFN22281.1 hypothetical protein TAMC210_05970 [Thermanaeromonas sp. C210]